MFDSIKTDDLSYKDIFNLSFAIYIKNIKPIVVLGLMVNIPMFVLMNVALPDSVIAPLLLIDFDSVQAGAIPDSLTQVLSIASSVAAVIMIIFVPLLAGGLTGLSIATIEKGEGSFSDMMAGSFGNIGKIIVTSALALLFMEVGFMLIFPGIYLGVLYAFSVPAVVVTGRWGLGALKESAYTTAGRWFKTFGFLILSFSFSIMCMFMQGSIIAIIFQFIPYYVILEFALTVAFSIFLLYFVLAEGVWFINKHYMFQKLKKNMNITQ